MDSRLKMLLGLALVLIGAFVTWVTYSAAAPGGRYVAFYGIIILGAGLFLVGLIQSITANGSGGGVERVLAGKTPEYKLLLRAMVAASELDGPLDQDKIYSIRDLAFKITKEEPYAATIKDVSAAMAKEGIKTSAYMAQVQSNFTTEVKQLVLQTSAALAKASANPERASQFISEMAAAFGLTAQTAIAV
jgi:hypothetical protein